MTMESLRHLMSPAREPGGPMRSVCGVQSWTLITAREGEPATCRRCLAMATLPPPAPATPSAVVTLSRVALGKLLADAWAEGYRVNTPGAANPYGETTT